jgi:hypothetical protein
VAGRRSIYKDSSGFGAKTVLDSFRQTHEWNAAGERKRWTMPGVPQSGNWTTSVSPVYDAAGNIETINRTLIGGSAATLMGANFRGAGRPVTRTVTTTTAGTIARGYSYDDNGTGQLTEMRVEAGGKTVAGAHDEYEGLQVNDIKLLGVSSDARHSHFDYDTRGRLTGSIYGSNRTSPEPGPTVPGSVAEGRTAADFRNTQTRTPKFDSATRSILASKGVDLTALDPGSVATGEQTGHKVASVAVGGNSPPGGHANVLLFGSRMPTNSSAAIFSIPVRLSGRFGDVGSARGQGRRPPSPAA